LYKLLALWLNNYTSQINIDIFDRSSVICERGNKRAKEYGIDRVVKFYCQDILDINVSEYKKKDVYICWKRKVTDCFALKVYLCAFSAGKQVC
jgi:ubiquinone/menaquinone biosynthesis C-methylase UbiE